MTLDQLRYALAVADLSSFRRAAEQLNISPSSLSEQVRNLEAELGVTLFYRNTRRVVVTPAGHELVEHGLEVLAGMSRLRHAVDEHRLQQRGHVRLGTTLQATASKLAKVLAKFNEQHRYVEVTLVEGSISQVTRMLVEHDLDLSLLTWPADRPPSDLDFVELERTETGVVVSRASPFATRKSVDLRELANYPLITYSEGFPARTIVFDACARAGFVPTIGLESSYTETICRMIAEGMGWSVLYSYRAREFGLRYLKCSPRPLDRVVTLSWHRGAQLRPHAETLKQYIVESWIFPLARGVHLHHGAGRTLSAAPVGSPSANR